jgi:curved DNA-binding protein CbpA
LRLITRASLPYLQLAAPVEIRNPYEVLEIRNDASLKVAEAAYKAKVRRLHPDAGGSHEHMKILNQAIEEIRRKST